MTDKQLLLDILCAMIRHTPLPFEVRSTGRDGVILPVVASPSRPPRTAQIIDIRTRLPYRIATHPKDQRETYHVRET